MLSEQQNSAIYYFSCEKYWKSRRKSVILHVKAIVLSLLEIMIIVWQS